MHLVEVIYQVLVFSASGNKHLRKKDNKGELAVKKLQAESSRKA